MGIYVCFVFMCIGLVIYSGICLTVHKTGALEILRLIFALAFILFVVIAVLDIGEFLNNIERHIENLYMIPAIILSFVFIRLVFHSGTMFVDTLLRKTGETGASSDTEHEMIAGVLAGLTLGCILAYFYGSYLESGSVNIRQLRQGVGIAFVVAFLWCCCLEIISRFVKCKQ